MKLTAPRNELLPALAFCRTILKSGASPILDHALLKASANELTIIAHGVSCSKEAAITVKTFEAGECTVPLEDFYLIVSGATAGQSINILLKERATISWGRSRYALNTLPVEHFPPAFSADKDEPLTLDANEREKLFERPTPLLLADQSMPLYCGVWLHDRGGKLSSIGSDGTRMVCTQIDQKIGGRLPVMVPREAALQIAQMEADEIWWSNSIICASKGNKTFSAKLLDTGYGDYQSVLPSLQNPSLEFDRSEFLGALRRLSAVAGRSSIVRLRWSDSPKSAALEFVSGEDGHEAINCTGKISAGAIGLPPVRFGDMIELLSGPKLKIHIGASMKPIRIVDQSDASLLAMAAPCRIPT